MTCRILGLHIHRIRTSDCIPAFKRVSGGAWRVPEFVLGQVSRQTRPFNQGQLLLKFLCHNNMGFGNVNEVIGVLVREFTVLVRERRLFGGQADANRMNPHPDQLLEELCAFVGDRPVWLV